MTPRAKRYRVLDRVALGTLLALCACANQEAPEERDAASDAVTDVARDATRDVVTDAAVDALDASNDSPVDAAREAGLDASADVGLDASVETGIDAAIETGVDASVDVGLDVVTDTSVDARVESGVDAVVDAGVDVRVDAGVDAGVDVRVDTGVDVVTDTGVPLGGCVSGAVGTYVARFRWTGSGSGSRASVSYEANTLPDHARWRVTANSRSIGYTPVYTDTFLAGGGIDLSGTTFIDVELSTAGIASLSNVTIAIFGRSFNTTASGSFAWQTFDGTGAAPSGLIANSAPYQWYGADATRAFRPGNGSVLLRITPGPPSGSIVVSRVEVCFDAR